MSSIWFNNVEVLFNKDNFSEIIPTKQMSFEENINAISRFTLYLSILLYLVSGNYLYLYIFVVTIIVFYLVYIFGGKEMFQGSSNINTPSETAPSGTDPSETAPSETAPSGTAPSETAPSGTTSNIIECKKPTRDNPLMNLMATDNFHQSLPACLNTDESVREEIDKSLKDKLYSDTNVIFNNRTNQRAFYTMPNTQPANDQTEFAKWLYQIPISCEEAKTGRLQLHRSCAYTQKSLGELQKEL